MFTIRKEQIDALRVPALESIVKRLMNHLIEHFPDPCVSMKKADLREMVCRGIEKAESFDFTSERDVCKYLSIVVCFGPDFDQEQNWATSILHGPPWSESIPKMDKLFELAVEHADDLAEQEGGAHDQSK